MSFAGFENIEPNWEKRTRHLRSKPRSPSGVKSDARNEIATHAKRQLSKTGKIYLPVTPMGKPRMTQADKFRPVHKRYFDFAGAVRSHWPAHIPYPNKDAWIVFYLPMPKSWSKKKRAEMCYRLHEPKPDKDNLEKALMDALHHGAKKDDSYVSDNRVSKLWAPTGFIEIYLDALEPVQNLINELRENGNTKR